MKIKENECALFKTADSLTKLNFDIKNHVIQIDDIRVSISKSSFSNTQLDSVFIPDNKNFQIIEYIVSQDPYEHSISDFLQMIWELRITFVISLTKMGKRKMSYFEYWASKNEDAFYNIRDGVYKLSTRTESVLGNLTERHLVIEKNSLERREIHQLHLTTPHIQEDSILNMYEKLFVKLHEIKSVGDCYPILFHSSNSNLDQCSMLICIDKIISSLVSGSQEINIFNTMLELSQYRNLMLQEEVHYFCIYEYIDWFLRKAIKMIKAKKRTKAKSLIEKGDN